jgi:predicted nucleic acid-binding protein
MRSGPWSPWPGSGRPVAIDPAPVWPYHSDLALPNDQVDLHSGRRHRPYAGGPGPSLEGLQVGGAPPRDPQRIAAGCRQRGAHRARSAPALPAPHPRPCRRLGGGHPNRAPRRVRASVLALAVIHLDRVSSSARWSEDLPRIAVGKTLAGSAIGGAEFLSGPIETDDPAHVTRITRGPVPCGEADSALSARLFNLGGRRRHSLLDCMIAAVALRAGAAVATATPSDFRRFEPAGLQLIRL